MRTLILAALLLSPSAWAQIEANSFEPALAAQQAQITADSLHWEAKQFQELAKWRSLQGKVKTSKGKTALLKRDLDRAQILVRSNQVTIEAYVTAKFLYEKNLSETARFEAEAAEALAKARVAKLQVLQSANAGADLRRELTQARLEAEENRVKSLQAALASTEEEHKLRELREKNGKTLVQRSALSEAGQDLRAFDTEDAASRAESLRAQIQVSEQMIQALHLALERL